MNKRLLTILLSVSSISFTLFAEEAAADAWKEDFQDGRRYIVQRIDNDAQKAANCRKEYKDGALILYYTFDPKSSPKTQGTFAYGIATPIELKGSTALEIRYRTPAKGLNNVMTWTYVDATGKRYGDWTKLPASTDWQTLRIEMDKGGFAGKKQAKPAPVKLIALDIYSTSKNDGVERSLEIDYIRSPAATAE